MSSSCQICYENFSNDSDDLIPRILNNCGHIICTLCIKNDLIDNAYYCPECMSECLGNIDDISRAITLEQINTNNTNNTDNNSTNTLTNETRGERSPSSSSTEQNRLPLSMRVSQHDLTRIDQIAKDIKNASFNIICDNKDNKKEIKVIQEDNKKLTPNDLKELFINQKRIELGDAMNLIDRARYMRMCIVYNVYSL